MKKGTLPSTLYIFIIALIVIGVIFLFFGILGDKSDLTINAIWDLLLGDKPNLGG